MSGFIQHNRQISALQTGPGFVAKDPLFFGKDKRTVDLAVSFASSGKRSGCTSSETIRTFFKIVFLLKVSVCCVLKSQQGGL